MIARNKTGRRQPCAQNSQTQAILGRIQVRNPGPYRAIPHDWAFWSYNTGKPMAGERNGYVARIYAAADHVVPAIRQAVPALSSSARDSGAAPPPNACGPPPPAWDGWAVSDYQSC